MCLTSFGSCVVQLRGYTMTDLDDEDGLVSLCLKLHYKTHEEEKKFKTTSLLAVQLKVSLFLKLHDKIY